MATESAMAVTLTLISGPVRQHIDSDDNVTRKELQRYIQQRYGVRSGPR